MSRKYLILAIAVVAVLALVTASTAYAWPATASTLQILQPTGEPFANQQVKVAIFNMTKNCVMAWASGTTDEYGNISLNLQPNPLDQPTSGRYNISVFWEAYGHTFLVYTRSNISAAQVADILSNSSIVLNFTWTFTFRAVTNINGHWNTPLVFQDPETGTYDLPYFKVYLAPSGLPGELPEKSSAVLIFEASGNKSAYATKNLTIATIMVDISESSTGCYHIDKFYNFTLFKDVYWQIHSPEGTEIKVWVGSERLAFNTTGTFESGNIVVDFQGINYTDLVDEGHKFLFDLTKLDDGTYVPVIGNETDHWVVFNDSAYTFIAYVNVNDICGQPLDYYINNVAFTNIIWPRITVFFSYGDFVVRKGIVNTYSMAPFEGYDPGIGTMFFWLPNVTLLLHKNITLTIVFMNVQIFSEQFNTTAATFYGGHTYLWKNPKPFQGTSYMNWSYIANYSGTGYNVNIFRVNTTLLPVDIVIKDSGVAAVQPLEGAKIILQPPGYDPIYTVTDYGGHVQLPPFSGLLGGVGDNNGPIIARLGTHPGLLPVPFSLRLKPSATYTYSLKILWSFPMSEYFVDVTPDDNTFELNASAALEHINATGNCYIHNFTFIAKVYDVAFKISDLCGRPITATDDPAGSVILTYTPPDSAKSLTVSIGLTKDGTIALSGVPGGTIKVQLAFKGVLLDPTANSTAKELAVNGNILNASENVFTFPIGDITFRVWSWDTFHTDNPLYLMNISVKLKYFKNGNLVFEQEGMTDCDGKVTFEKVPLKVSTNTSATNEVLVELYTTNYTPYIRHNLTTTTRDKHIDVDLLVGNWSLTNYIFKKAEPACSNDIDIPAWIFSFYLEADDHAGRVLKEFPATLNGSRTMWVGVALNDSYWELQPSECTVHCPCQYDTNATWSIFNLTGFGDEAFGNGMKEARWVFTSGQFDKNHPHLFVAGAKYDFIVWYGGVIVYNYTITLPRPSKALDWNDTIDTLALINETDLTITVKELKNPSNVDIAAKYTWNLTKGGEITHPFYYFIGTKPGAKPTLRLITWVSDLKVYALSNGGKGLVPGLNLTLIYADAINPYFFEHIYYNRGGYNPLWYNLVHAALYYGGSWHNTHEVIWYKRTVDYAYSAVDGGEGDLDGAKNGVIVVPVPMWQPTVPRNRAWTSSNYVKFGGIIKGVYLLAGDKYGTPNVPDTPQNFYENYYMTTSNPYYGTWYFRSSGTGMKVYFYGYLVGPWNFTTSTLDTYTKDWTYVNRPATELYPEWYKFYAGKWYEFRANKSTAWIGGVPNYDKSSWNMTLWSGAAKVVRTTAMDGFCACVKTPEGSGMKNQPVEVYVNGMNAVECPECATAMATGYTGADGCVLFKPKTSGTTSTPIGDMPVYSDVVAYKFNISAAHSWFLKANLNYTFKTWLNIDDMVKPYGLTTKDVIDPDTMSYTIQFGEKNNIVGDEIPKPTGCCPEQICVELGWSAIKVQVFDWAGRPLKNAMVAAILRSPASKSMPSAINFTDSTGSTEIYVPPGNNEYQLLVYWRDSYLLFKAGKIPKSIVIFDTVTDYDTPRTYKPGEGTTLETFVYVGMIKLVNADGKPLSPEALKKIKVTITWPDQVVTEHTPQDDGRVMIILNKDTVKSWPAPESAKYSPETPADIQSQAPHGAYKVVVTWEGVGTVAQQTISIEKGRFETSKQEFVVKLDVYDVTLSFKTPFGTPLAGATVEVVKPGSSQPITATLDANGEITIPEVPPGQLKVTVKNWKGLNINYETTVAREIAAITVDNIGKMVVHVVGSRGQGLAGASVDIANVGTFTTDSSGTVELELPAGTYKVTASKGGRTASTTVAVQGGKTATAELKLDIFISIAGWEMSSSEFLGMLLLFIILVIVLFIIAHEYSAWRKRRLAKVIAPAKE